MIPILGNKSISFKVKNVLHFNTGKSSNDTFATKLKTWHQKYLILGYEM